MPPHGPSKPPPPGGPGSLDQGQPRPPLQTVPAQRLTHRSPISRRSLRPLWPTPHKEDPTDFAFVDDISFLLTDNTCPEEDYRPGLKTLHTDAVNTAILSLGDNEVLGAPRLPPCTRTASHSPEHKRVCCHSYAPATAASSTHTVKGSAWSRPTTAQTALGPHTPLGTSLAVPPTPPT